MVAVLAVAGARHRVADQPGLKGCLLDPPGQPQGRIKRLLCVPVGDQLHPAEQPAAADVAHIGMLAETVLQRRLQLLTHFRAALHQAALQHCLDHGKARSGGHRVADIGVAVLEEA